MRQAFIAMRIRLLAGLAAVALAACGGGAPTSENPNTTPPTQPAYNGPPPATADVQAFRINLWDNIKASNRCGGCHVAGQQAPMFARQDDINLAYEAANGIVNLSDPSSSRILDINLQLGRNLRLRRRDGFHRDVGPVEIAAVHD